MNNILILYPSIVRPLILKWRLTFKTIWILGLALIVFLLGFYIFQVNNITQASFAVSTYEKQISELAQKGKSLEMEFSGLSSLVSMENLVNRLNYEKVEKVHYIQMLADTVVVK